MNAPSPHPIKTARSRWISAFVLAAALCGTRAAPANSTRFTTSGLPFRWTNPAITLRYSPDNLAAITGDAAGGVRSASLAWSLVPKATRIDVSDRGASGRAGYTTGAPSSNELIYYLSGFPVSTRALAVTVVSSSDQTGEIYDADVLVQGARYPFQQLGPLGLASSPSAPFDFQSMLTHEFGHVLGLGEDNATPEATMFPTAMPGAVTQRSLTLTDIDSLSRAYAADPSPDAPGCALRVARRRPSPATCLPLLALCAALCARRRSRPHTRALLALGATLLIVWAVPTPGAGATGELTVIDARSRLRDGWIYTTATVDRDGATEEVTLLGGVHGALRQDVLDAPSGAALTAGARVTLDGARVVRVRSASVQRGSSAAPTPED